MIDPLRGWRWLPHWAVALLPLGLMLRYADWKARRGCQWEGWSTTEERAKYGYPQGFPRE